MKKYLLLFLCVSFTCFAQEEKATPTPALKATPVDVHRFKSAIREEQAKTQLSVVKIGENYESTGGIYKSITKASIKESYPFGFEFDGKHFLLEPLSVEWDTYETAVNMTAYKEDITKVSTATKIANTITYPAIGGVVYSVSAETEEWRKVVTIDPKQLTIPKGAKYLILSFKVDTNFTLPKDRTSQRFEVNEDCWLEPAKVGILGSTEYATIEHEFDKGIYYKYIPISALIETVVTDVDFTFGSEEVFNEHTTNQVCCSMLSDTSGFITYTSYVGAVNVPTAIAFTISGTDFTFGASEVFDDGTIDYVNSVGMSSSSGVIVYQDVSESYYGTAIAFTLSGTDFTWGTEEVFNTASSPWPVVAKLTDTKGFIAFNDNDTGYGTAIAFTLSGTDFTWGAEEQFNASTAAYSVCASLSSSSGVIVYSDGGASWRCTAIAFTISGTDFTWGTEEFFDSSSYIYASVSTLSSTSGFIVYNDVGNSNYGTAIAFTVSNRDFTWGTEEAFDTRIYQVDCVSLTETSGLITYRDSVDSSYGKMKSFSLSGTDFTWGEEVTFNNKGTIYISMSMLTSSLGVIVYKDSLYDYGETVAFTIPSSVGSTSNPFMGVAF